MVRVVGKFQCVILSVMEIVEFPEPQLVKVHGTQGEGTCTLELAARTIVVEPPLPVGLLKTKSGGISLATDSVE